TPVKLLFHSRLQRPPKPTHLPYPTLFRSPAVERDHAARGRGERGRAARRLAEGGPLAEDLPGGHGADRLALHQQGHFALEQVVRSEEHTSELQSRFDLVCRLLLEKKKSNR